MVIYNQHTKLFKGLGKQLDKQRDSALLPAWFIFNPNMDKQLHAQ